MHSQVHYLLDLFLKSLGEANYLIFLLVYVIIVLLGF